MDVSESEQSHQKDRSVDAETPRPPLVPADKNNAFATRRPRTREVSSRYKSPTPATPTGPWRCSSPNITRTTAKSSQLAPKRAQSAERKRPSTPPSPSSPSTPIRDTSVYTKLSSRRAASGHSSESLWPSTRRSLSVSFQSDTISIPVSKKEKPVSSVSYDRTLQPSSNVARRHVEASSVPRKPTPERKRSPLNGKINASDQSENSKPVDVLPAQLIEQHRWPSRIGGKFSLNLSNKSTDLSDKISGMLSTQGSGSGLPSLRKMPISDGVSKPLQTSGKDAAKLFTLDVRSRAGLEVEKVDDNPLNVLRAHKVLSTSPRISMSAVKTQSSPSPGSCLPSPRGLSPSRTRPSTPPSRGVSPSRIRPMTSSCQSDSSTSVLSFIADLKKGKKGATHIDDAHQLRLLYNRHLQWRFANAQAEAVLNIQKASVERTLYDAWNTTSCLWDSVIRKRINLQQLKLELKLNSGLNGQMAYLDDWALLERDHVDALCGAVEDLEASTLRLPIMGRAKADIDSLKAAICSAVDVMQAMGSSLCSLLSRVEGMNNLVSELALVAAQEKAMLDECELLLESRAAIQVEEYSLRTHLIQALGTAKPQ